MFSFFLIVLGLLLVRFNDFICFVFFGNYFLIFLICFRNFLYKCRFFLIFECWSLRLDLRLCCLWVILVIFVCILVLGFDWMFMICKSCWFDFFIRCICLLFFFIFLIIVYVFEGRNLKNCFSCFFYVLG